MISRTIKGEEGVKVKAGKVDYFYFLDDALEYIQSWSDDDISGR